MNKLMLVYVWLISHLSFTLEVLSMTHGFIYQPRMWHIKHTVLCGHVLPCYKLKDIFVSSLQKFS